MTSVESNKELARRFLEEVINARNVSAIQAFMVSGSMFAGAFEGFVTNYIQTGFPDCRLKIEDIFSEEDKALIETTATATQTGVAMGRPPSGKRIHQL